MITVLGIYLFIVIGFFAKKNFKEIEGKTLVILSTYFLQPFLTLWGIMLVPINFDLILSPLIYLMAVFLAFFIAYFIFNFKDKKLKTIAVITPLIGNTGNLGIPLSYALFGNTGAAIATMINLANVFFIYSFGIFFFAKGKYEFRDAFKKIIKIPVLWFGILALVLNISGFKFSAEIMKILQMGAYASIVIQLLIFGVYLAETKIKEVGKVLGAVVLFNKFILLPLVTYVLLKLFNLPPVFKKVVLLEVLTPLAVTNVNLAALFDLYPERVAFLVVVSSVIFMGVAFLFI
ncbi:AEC family transporter [Caminibacter sp.]